MSIKQINGNMSDLEERIIISLWALDIHLGVGRSDTFSGAAVAYVLGGRWTSYRHKVMMRLAARGWVFVEDVKDGRPRWYYRLTPEAKTAFKERLQDAVNKGVRLQGASIVSS